MDPKKQGVVFEALTYLALTDLGYEVHWGEKPEGSVLDAPTRWGFVTSNGPTKNLDKECWRNVSEAFLAELSSEMHPKLGDLVASLS